jgi:uncharacterized protein YbjT (DUF2867 family)
MLIAVTGATGELGGRVARRLSARGVEQRLVVRDPSRAPQLDGAHVRQSPGFHDGEAMRAAFAGADTLFLVPAAEAVDRVEQHYTAVDAAAAAGVRRIVYLSFVNARPDAAFTLVRHHYLTEERIRQTGVAFTFVRMNLYMDFLPGMFGEDGVIRGPAGNGRVGAVLRDDVADVVAAVLTQDGHAGETYDVTGPEAFTLHEAAATITEVTGRPASYIEETVEEAWESRRVYGAPDWEVEGWVTSYTAIAAGELDLVADTVERLAGHPPTTLADYARTLRAPAGS